MEIPAAVVVAVEEPDWELSVAVGQQRLLLVERPDWPKGQRQTLAWGRVHNESSIRLWEVLRVGVHPRPHFDSGYPHGQGVQWRVG